METEARVAALGERGWELADASCCQMRRHQGGRAWLLAQVQRVAPLEREHDSRAFVAVASVVDLDAEGASALEAEVKRDIAAAEGQGALARLSQQDLDGLVAERVFEQDVAIYARELALCEPTSYEAAEGAVLSWCETCRVAA